MGFQAPLEQASESLATHRTAISVVCHLKSAIYNLRFRKPGRSFFDEKQNWVFLRFSFALQPLTCMLVLLLI